MAALLADLRRDEGRRLKPYYDSVGKLTIGYGHNLTDLGITPAQAEELLRDDANRHVLELEGLLPWVKTLDPVRQRAMGNLAFNLGVPKLLKFPVFLAKAEAGDYKGAAAALVDSLWMRQVGVRGDRIVTMWRDGVDPAA